MELKTKRLILRPLLDSDAELRKELINSDIEISENTMIPPKQSLEEHLEYIHEVQKQMIEETDFIFAIIHENVLIGACGLHDLKKEISGIGFWISKEFRSKGYTTEAAKAIIKIAKEKGVKIIKTNVYEWNIGSMKVLEKIGFKKIEKGTHIRKWDNKEVPEFYYELNL